MYKVLGIQKLPDTDPQEYELSLHDSENAKAGYMQTTKYGTEEQIRAILKDGGLTDPVIDLYFANAR